MRATRQAGLTLLEMMIAMLLLSMLLVLLFGGLRLASRSWDRGASYTDDVSQMQLVESFLRREIAEVFPYRLRQNPARPNAVFLGYEAGPQSLRFVATMPAAGGRGGLYILRLALAPSAKGQALMLWRSPVGATDNADAADQPLRLVDGVRSLKFAYFGVPAGDPGPPAWHNHWGDPTNAPALVRMQLELDDGRTWPDLIVAPRIDLRAPAV